MQQSLTAAVEQPQAQRAALIERLLEELELHYGAAHRFLADSGLEGDEAELLYLYQEVHALGLQLQERVQAHTDRLPHWQELEDGLNQLAQAATRAGHRNWSASGPTGSRRLNQLIYLCGWPPGTEREEQSRVLVADLETLMERLTTEYPDPNLRSRFEALENALEEVKAALKGQVFNLGPHCRALAQAVSSLDPPLPQAIFDREVSKDHTWLDGFLDLAEAVFAGEVEGGFLIRERDLMLERLSGAQPRLEAMEDLIEALMALENHLQDPEEFDAWSVMVDEVWSELQQKLEDQLNPTLGCPVCGRKLPLGTRQCPTCHSRMPGGTGDYRSQASDSALLEGMKQSWSSFARGEISRDQLQARFRKILAEVTALLKASSSELQPRERRQRELLVQFETELRDLCDSEEDLADLWQRTLAAGEQVTEEMIRNGTN